MLVPVVCWTCGKSLGDIAPIYNICRRNRMLARYGAEALADPPRILPSMALTLDVEQQKNMLEDVLDALKVHGCCRTHLVTAMDFRTFY